MFLPSVFTICFFGHRHLYRTDQLEEKVEQLFKSLLQEKDYIECLIGRDSDFDILVASIIHRIQKSDGNNRCTLTWVMPYELSAFRKNEQAFCQYYDAIEISETSATSHYKAAFRKRNQAMIDQSDLVVFYVETSFGGAYQAMQYAAKQKKAFINLAE